MLLKHSGQSLVRELTSGSVLRASARRFIGFTTTKKMAAATSRKVMIALRNSP